LPGDGVDDDGEDDDVAFYPEGRALVVDPDLRTDGRFVGRRIEGQVGGYGVCGEAPQRLAMIPAFEDVAIFRSCIES
jgi:hypothetical protein